MTVHTGASIARRLWQARESVLRSFDRADLKWSTMASDVRRIQYGDVRERARIMAANSKPLEDQEQAKQIISELSLEQYIDRRDKFCR